MANTVTLNYSEAGQGMPVVLLHGFPLSAAIWHEQQQRLSEIYHEPLVGMLALALTLVPERNQTMGYVIGGIAAIVGGATLSLWGGRRAKQ